MGNYEKVFFQALQKQFNSWFENLYLSIFQPTQMIMPQMIMLTQTKMVKLLTDNEVNLGNGGSLVLALFRNILQKMKFVYKFDMT